MDIALAGERLREVLDGGLTTGIWTREPSFEGQKHHDGVLGPEMIHKGPGGLWGAAIHCRFHLERAEGVTSLA